MYDTQQGLNEVKIIEPILLKQLIIRQIFNKLSIILSLISFYYRVLYANVTSCFYPFINVLTVFVLFYFCSRDTISRDVFFCDPEKIQNDTSWAQTLTTVHGAIYDRFCQVFFCPALISEVQNNGCQSVIEHRAGTLWFAYSDQIFHNIQRIIFSRLLLFFQSKKNCQQFLVDLKPLKACILS